MCPPRLVAGVVVCMPNISLFAKRTRGFLQGEDVIRLLKL